jgi:transposase
MERLIREGMPIAQVARTLGRSRQTIYNWQKDEGAEVVQPRPSKLDAYVAHLESRLERFDLPATVLLRELRGQGYEGGLTILKERVAAIKERHVQRLVDRFETEPGRQAQVDFASCGVIHHRGRRMRLSLVVMVLGYSRMIWARFVVSERRPVLLECLEAAFRELGGAPRELLFDNLKQVVAQPRSAEGPARIQGGFQAFADHFGCEVVACPPYWPRAKGKVERAIGYLKTSFLEGRTFTDLEDLNAQLRVWLAEVANVRRHGTTGERPVDRLAADRAAMLALTRVEPFPSVIVAERLVDHDGLLSYGGVRYSVDPEILSGRRGEPVEVHVGADGRLRCYHQGRLVGEHVVAPSGSPPREDARHAVARRRLRQRPRDQEANRSPRFEQRLPNEPTRSLPPPPQVAVPSLADYEVGSCKPN